MGFFKEEPSALDTLQREQEKEQAKQERQLRREAAAKKLKTAGHLIGEAARVLLPTIGSFAGSYIGAQKGFTGQSVPVDAVVDTPPAPAPVNIDVPSNNG